jgi:hypothetical protein
MTERIINLLLLAVAIAHLTTDALHLGFKVSSPRHIDEPVPIPARSGPQEMPRPPPEDDPPAAAADVRLRHTEPAPPAFRRLPLDFSINQPPWCPACRHHDPPRFERRHQGRW